MEWAQPVEELYRSLDARFEGLTSEEATKRLQKYGQNIIPSGQKISPLSLFLNQFRDLLVLILIAAGIITALIAIIELLEH